MEEGGVAEWVPVGIEVLGVLIRVVLCFIFEMSRPTDEKMGMCEMRFPVCTTTLS